MKRFLGIAFGLALSTATYAADLPAASTSPIAHPWAQSAPGAIISWGGLFIGINGGGATGTSSWTAGALTTGDFDVSGGMAGATAGYNWQHGPWVFSVLGDIDWANISGSTSNFCYPNCATSSDWFGTARGRVGYAKGPFLPYITGGVAFGQISAHFADNSSGSASDTRIGWTVGAGLEYALPRNWSMWGEVLYTDLGSVSCPSTVCIGPPVASAVPLTGTVFRLGLNRRF